MRKVLSIFLPHFATDLLRRRLYRSGARHDAASIRILLTRADHGRSVVARACAAAIDAGVKPGMSLSHARALLGDVSLHVSDHQPDQDAARLAALAQWAGRFAPIVEPDAPDGLLLDVTGCGRIYRGQKRLLRIVTRAIARLGFTVRSPVASHVGAAWALARFGEKAVAVATDEQLHDLLSPLPIAALRIDDDTIAGLGEVAIDTIGDLLAIDRVELAERFDARLLDRLDQALGRSFEPLEPCVVVERPNVERRFAGPVKQLEAVEITVQALLADLCGELRRRGVGITRLDMHVERYDAEPIEHRVTLSRLTLDPEHLWTLLAPAIERLNMGHGVEMIRLTAGEFARIAHDQHPLAPALAGVGRANLHPAGAPTVTPAKAGANDEALGRFIDVAQAKLGHERVTRVVVRETHAPEAAFAFEPIAGVGRRPSAPGLHGVGRMDSHLAADLTISPAKAGAKDEARLVDADRPSQLEARPQRIEVVALAPDGPVVSMRMGGESRRIVTSIGPERIAGRWWLLPDASGSPPVRDYFKVQDEAGIWRWIYRDQATGRWRCQGRWG